MSKRYVVGPQVDIGLPFGLGIEVDALYRREGYQGGPVLYNGDFTEHANSWEFPLLLKYRLPVPLLRPFLEVGYAPRVISGRVHYYTSNTVSGTDYPASQGVVVGGGVQFGVGRLPWRPRSATRIGTTLPSSSTSGMGRHLYQTKTRQTSCSASPGNCDSSGLDATTSALHRQLRLLAMQWGHFQLLNLGKHRPGGTRQLAPHRGPRGNPLAGIRRRYQRGQSAGRVQIWRDTGISSPVAQAEENSRLSAQIKRGTSFRLAHRCAMIEKWELPAR